MPGKSARSSGYQFTLVRGMPKWMHTSIGSASTLPCQ